MRKQNILFQTKMLFLCIGLLALSQLTWAQDVNNTKPNILGPNGVSVNSYSGNLFLNRSDLFIPGQGLNLEIVFAYNTSKRGIDWGFGRGWVLNYNMACMPDSAGIALERMDGRRDVFTKKNGSLVAPAGVFETLQEYEVGKFKLLSKNGTTYYFENAAHHRLTKITDRNNNALALSYTDTLLTEVSDAAGRKLSFTWAQGRLQKINTNTKPARSIQFQYDKSGNPIRVINPGGGTREYRYDEANKIITVIDENGNPVNIDYNSNEAVTKISSCFGTQNIFYDYGQYKTHVTERVANELQLTTYEYDTLGLLKAQTGNCCGYSMRFFYDAQKNISKKIDAKGNEMLYTYDGKGNLLQSVDALQQIEQWQYEPVFNQIIKMTDKNGNVRNYEYDAKGNLTKITHPLGILESYTYDEFGNRLSYTDGNGNTTRYEYDSFGYLTKIIDPNQGTTLNEHDELGNLLGSTDPNQHKTQWVYDDLNRIISTIDALGQQETYEYDNVGNVLSGKDKSSNQTLYTYDALNRLTLVKNALGGTQLFEYDVRGNLRRWVDENKNATQYSYDLLNRLVEVKNALNERTIFDYDNNGNLTSIILPNGNEMDLSYDKLDRLTAVQDKIGLLAQMGYDKNSNRISFTDANSNTYTFSYDALNRLIKQADPLSGDLNLSYDKNSNVGTLTDQNGHTTTYTYDKLNRRIAVKDAINATSNYSYDLAGNQIAVIDQNGNQTRYKYDALDRLVEEIYPDGSAMQYRYNPTNQVISRTDNDGKITTYTFDPLYRLTGRSYADGSQEGFSYDAQGNLLSAQNQYALVRFTYDALHRRSTETLNTYQSNFTYDTKNRKRSITYPSGRKLNLNLDERNRLQEIIDPLLGENPLARFEYNPLGQLSKLSYANTAVNDMTYDANARITGLQYAFKNQNQSYQYNYDKLGNRTRELNATQTDRSRVYAYDAIDRLTQVQEGVISGSNTIVNPLRQGKYTFDAIGNRKSTEEQQQSKTYTSNTLNQYTNISQGNTNRSLSYDKNGNLTFDGQFNLGYDPENRLTAVDNGTTALYRYDALGRRIQKIIKQDTTFYLYNGLDLIEERGNKGLLKASFVYGDNIDQVLSMQRNGKNYYYHSDPLGSARKISDDVGNVVEQYEYDAYGQVRFYNAAGQVLSASAIGNSFLFTGREYDVETGMYHYRARSFAPELGRFGQRDPLGFVEGLNGYSYVINNPVNFVDPLGATGTAVASRPVAYPNAPAVRPVTGPSAPTLPRPIPVGPTVAAGVAAGEAVAVGTGTVGAVEAAGAVATSVAAAELVAAVVIVAGVAILVYMTIDEINKNLNNNQDQAIKPCPVNSRIQPVPKIYPTQPWKPNPARERERREREERERREREKREKEKERKD